MGRLKQDRREGDSGSRRSRVEVIAEHVELPEGFPDHVVRTVNGNSSTLKFTDHGFEHE